MTLKVNNDANVNTYKLIKQDSSVASAADVNVTGDSGEMLSLEISNGGSTHTSYVKFKLTSGTVTTGTTEPDLMLSCGPNTAERYDFPNGLGFSQLTFWSTRLPATSDTTAPNTTIVTILTQ